VQVQIANVSDAVRVTAAIQYNTIFVQ